MKGGRDRGSTRERPRASPQGKARGISMRPGRRSWASRIEEYFLHIISSPPRRGGETSAPRQDLALRLYDEAVMDRQHDEVANPDQIAHDPFGDPRVDPLQLQPQPGAEPGGAAAGRARRRRSGLVESGVGFTPSTRAECFLARRGALIGHPRRGRPVRTFAGLNRAPRHRLRPASASPCRGEQLALGLGAGGRCGVHGAWPSRLRVKSGQEGRQEKDGPPCADLSS